MKDSLPDSAGDLLIKDVKLLMRSLSLYETLKRFSHIIRLTPFKFEDFTAALLADEQSPLLAEIHIQLLKTLIREDRLQQTWLGPQDIKDSVNLHLYLADHISWPASLRIYLSADSYINADILDQLNLNHKDYPLDVSIDVRLEVLEHLCDKFLLSNLAREEIVNGRSGISKHDTTCRLCSKPGGPLLMCSTCPAIYHYKCSDPPFEDPPDEPYECLICRLNYTPAVSDCLTQDELDGNLKRHDPLGIDKQNRTYWFIIRRLFVVDEKEDVVTYFTSENQLVDVLNYLKESKNDRELIANLEANYEEIVRQMQITHELCKNLPEDFRDIDGKLVKFLGQDGAHKNYINHYTSSLSTSKTQSGDKEVNRSLTNKFCINVGSFKWYGAIDGHQFAISSTIKGTLLKFEASLPQTFVHPCWIQQRGSWMKRLSMATNVVDYANALCMLETCIKPVLFKAAWYEAIGFTQLFRSTLLEREELKKTDRQPRGFERREWFVADIELSRELGTFVKFSPKLKPVKHQVWKQKGEEYRITGLNGWSWRSKNHRPRLVKSRKKPNSNLIDLIENNVGRLKKRIQDSEETKQQLQNQPQLQQPTQQNQQVPIIRKCVTARPKMPPTHDFLTRRTKQKTIFVLPELELRKLARSGGMRETRSFSYIAKQNNYVWPYGMTPRPTFRTCWLYKNQLLTSMQEVALQLKVLHAALRWDDLATRPPASGKNTIVTDDSTITIQLLRKRDRLPYLIHSEYLIRKTITPTEQPTKYRKLTPKVAKPSARSGLRARRQTEDEEPKGPTIEEIWVPEEQLELWELRHFDEEIERQNRLIREKSLREENEKRRKLDEERRRSIEAERRKRIQEEEALRRERLAKSVPTTPIISIPNQATTPLRSTNIVNPNGCTVRPVTTTPVLRYFRTDQGQIIRLPASYLQRGTPLILRHVGPGSSQTNTYIIRPQVTNANMTVNNVNNSPNTPNTTSSTNTPTTPNLPTNPQTPNNPTTPNNKSNPTSPPTLNNPNNPTTPQTLNNSDNPITPNITNNPGSSNKPNNLKTPNSPNNQNKSNIQDGLKTPEKLNNSNTQDGPNTTDLPKNQNSSNTRDALNTPVPPNNPNNLNTHDTPSIPDPPNPPEIPTNTNTSDSVNTTQVKMESQNPIQPADATSVSAHALEPNTQKSTCSDQSECDQVFSVQK